MRAGEVAELNVGPDVLKLPEKEPEKPRRSWWDWLTGRRSR